MQKQTLCFLAHIYEHAMQHNGVNYGSPCSQMMLHWLAQLDIQTERKILPLPKFVLCLPFTLQSIKVNTSGIDFEHQAGNCIKIQEKYD